MFTPKNSLLKRSFLQSRSNVFRHFATKNDIVDDNTKMVQLLSFSLNYIFKKDVQRISYDHCFHLI